MSSSITQHPHTFCILYCKCMYMTEVFDASAKLFITSAKALKQLSDHCSRENRQGKCPLDCLGVSKWG